ncbi:DUF4468 domain-containing protein [Mucilaginibacter sp.]|jgi:hypothetical protein|uniref:DUF4468 domain-containing protein n=1 Tax=Mucilaginibacter sp. TaxID=1882438 RepID=UPI002C5B96BF|nr:DUF4468 domain-containing protein [Mucilaginibacter sp.]HTI60766.1 DUF4468 domain-containing protein [Mucilaginibacter sp.]
MKFFLPIILLFALSFRCLSQNVALPLKDSLIYYEEVVTAPDTANKDILFSLAQTWFANAFKNSKSVLQVNDRQSMKLIGKGVSLLRNGYGNRSDEYIYYTIAVDIKPGRYRYRIYDFGFESGSQTEEASIGYSHYLHGEIHKMVLESKKQALKRYEYDYRMIGLTATSLIGSLKNAMNNLNADNF